MPYTGPEPARRPLSSDDITDGIISPADMNDNAAFVFNDSGGNNDFRIEGDTDTDLLFLDASTDRVGISTNAPAVTFDVSGTMRSSVGLLFGTDTAAANTLDDYEEGSFTPSATIGGTTAATIAGAEGRYVKIGNVIHVQGVISVNRGAGETGAYIITNLPFSGSSTGQNYTCYLWCNDYVELHDATNGEIQVLIRPATADVYFYAAPTSITAQLNGALAQNILRQSYNAQIQFCGWYSI